MTKLYVFLCLLVVILVGVACSNGGTPPTTESSPPPSPSSAPTFTPVSTPRLVSVSPFDVIYPSNYSPAKSKHYFEVSIYPTPNATQVERDFLLEGVCFLVEPADQPRWRLLASTMQIFVDAQIFLDELWTTGSFVHEFWQCFTTRSFAPGQHHVKVRFLIEREQEFIYMWDFTIEE